MRCEILFILFVLGMIWNIGEAIYRLATENDETYSWKDSALYNIIAFAVKVLILLYVLEVIG